MSRPRHAADRCTRRRRFRRCPNVGLYAGRRCADCRTGVAA